MAETRAIFYGAGEHARQHLRKWLEDGLIPVCFADADASKHHTFFEDDLIRPYGGSGEVLSLREATSLHPELDIYVTLAHENLLAVTAYLEQNDIPKGKIRYLGPNGPMVRRLGCELLGYSFGMQSNNTILPCCEPSRVIEFPANDDGFKRFAEYTADKIERLTRGELGDCAGCRLLKEDYWTTKPLLNKIVICLGFSGRRCGYNCVYCRTAWSDLLLDDGSLLKPLRKAYAMTTRLGAKEPSFVISTEELANFPDLSEAFAFMREFGRHASFVLTGLHFHEEIADLHKIGKCLTINISLDSGTAATFKRIKQVDAFDRVVGNIARYHASGVRVALKYIFLEGLNDNADDVAGFLNIAKSFASDVNISADLRCIDKPAARETMDAIKLMVAGLKASRTTFYIHWQFFNEQDRPELELLAGN